MRDAVEQNPAVDAAAIFGSVAAGSDRRTGRHDHAWIDRVINAVHMQLETTPERAKDAGMLCARSGVLDVVDAIVVAEAVAALPAVIVTSDPEDIGALVDAANGTLIRLTPSDWPPTLGSAPCSRTEDLSGARQV